MDYKGANAMFNGGNVANPLSVEVLGDIIHWSDGNTGAIYVYDLKSSRMWI